MMKVGTRMTITTKSTTMISTNNSDNNIKVMIMVMMAVKGTHNDNNDIK